MDKGQYFNLEFCLYPILYPNKETERRWRVKQFIFLALVLVKDELMLLEKLLTSIQLLCVHKMMLVVFEKHVNCVKLQ